MNGEIKTSFARAVAPALGIALVTLSCPAPVLASAFSVAGWVEQSFYEAGPPGASSVSPTGAAFTQQFVTGDINLNSSAAASSGNLSLFALASINNMGNWSSGHVMSTASAGIVEPVAPWWQLWVAPGETLVFEYEFEVTGALYTTSAGHGAAGSEARLGYSYRVGDSSGGGNWWRNSAGQVSQSGTWNGIIQSSFTVQRFETFNLRLLANARADGRKTYRPGSDTTLVGIADFSHTLTWLGITGVQAFDNLGNEIPLPPDFSLPLIGQESGFDYWHSAAGEPTEVPEPATVLLFGAVWGVVAISRKSAARRSDL